MVKKKRVGQPTPREIKTTKYALRLSQPEKQEILDRGGAKYIRALIAKDRKEDTSLVAQA